MVGGDEQQRCQVDRQQAAQNRHMEDEVRRQQDDGGLDQPDGDVGHDLARHHLDRPHGHRQQILHRAALAFARHG
ncbi:hypothetical protein G6F65_022088 [Rhizopus arrhizus]|nr:hypothetical protein G6F65_022088 [Rhizopus arrhizus]